jgi:hypothetical protein
MSIKDNLQQQLESSLEKWKSEIDEAEAKARAARADAEAEAARADLEKALWTRVEDLRAKTRDAEQRLSELKSATEDEVARLKDQVERLVA